MEDKRVSLLSPAPTFVSMPPLKGCRSLRLNGLHREDAQQGQTFDRIPVHGFCPKEKITKMTPRLGVVAHASTPSTWEPEVGGLGEFKASLGLHRPCLKKATPKR